MRRRALLLAAASALAGPRTGGATRPPQTLAFPRDHGAHPEARLEWWYLTGWLDLPEPEARSLGVQVTFFRARTGVTAAAGRYSPDQVLIAHAAIADSRRGALLHEQRIQRLSAPLVTAATHDTDLRLDGWRLARAAASGAYTARIAARQFELELSARPTQAPLLQGEAGWSRKGPGSEHASWYVSEPQLALEARLAQGGAMRRASGNGWLDHEWSDALLDPGAAGWDWIGMNLDDGAALTAFRIRARAGDAPIWAYASLRDAGGRTTQYGPGAVEFSTLAEWRSPRTGATYPVAQRIRVGDRRFDTQPLMNDQELDARATTGAVYWEGASTLLEAGRRVGRGYLEMTGYVEPMRL